MKKFPNLMKNGLLNDFDKYSDFIIVFLHEKYLKNEYNLKTMHNIS